MDEEPKINVQMFGFFDIFYQGQSILLDEGNSGKSLDILKFLIAQRNTVFLPESIAENVWPGNGYLEPKKVVRTYIHRLRKIIKLENKCKLDFSEDIRILNVKGSYKLELSGRVVLDTEVFEHCCEIEKDVSDRNELRAIFKDIAIMYKWKFLEGNRTEDWVIMFRNYYLRNFCSAVNSILEKLEAMKEYRSILEVCEKSLRIYDLDEAINMHFLNALIAMNQTGIAVQHYNFMVAKMHNVLSIMPSEKMKEVYVTLQSNGSNVRDIDKDVYDLSLVLGEIVREQLNERNPKLMVGIVQVTNIERKENPARDLEFALKSVLRKRDMYAIIGDNAAIVILSEVKEEFFPRIVERIGRVLHYANPVEINVYALTDIK